MLALQYVLVSSSMVVSSSSLFTLQSILVSSSLASLVGSNSLAALLLVSWATVTRPANRGGGRGESRAWMAKAHVEGHVDTASSGGEVEGGISTRRPNIQELCQGSLDEVVVGHLEVEGLEEDHSESKRVVIFTGKSDISRVGIDTSDLKVLLQIYSKA